MNMGVFSGGMNEMSSNKSPHQCKRDYEGDINRLHTQVKTASALLLAIDDYCDVSYSDGNSVITLNGLIGGLTREIKAGNRNIATLQTEWEDGGKP